MNCFYHTDVSGVAICINGCGKSLCRGCAEVYQKSICEDCAREIKARNIEEENLQKSELRAAKNQTRKAIKVYLITALISSIVLWTIISNFGPSAMILIWVITGFLFGVVSLSKDARFSDYGFIKKIQHVMAGIVFGPAIMSILCLIGWSRVAGEIYE